MEVKIKKLHENAVIPTYAKNGDAGMDLTAIDISYDDHGNVVYHTGLAFEIPNGYFAQLIPRSSNTKKDLVLGNSVGVLDSGYRGEVIFKYKALLAPDQDPEFGIRGYDIGDRIGQIIILPYPKIEFIEVDELSSTERGNGGFGSSGA